MGLLEVHCSGKMYILCYVCTHIVVYGLHAVVLGYGDVIELEERHVPIESNLLRSAGLQASGASEKWKVWEIAGILATMHKFGYVTLTGQAESMPFIKTR